MSSLCELLTELVRVAYMSMGRKLLPAVWTIYQWLHHRRMAALSPTLLLLAVFKVGVGPHVPFPVS